MNDIEYKEIIFSVNEKYQELIYDILENGKSMKELCEKYNISRQYISSYIINDLSNIIYRKVNYRILLNTYYNKELNKLSKRAYDFVYSSINRRRNLISKNIRESIIICDSICSKCGSNKNLEIDHIIPISIGGKSDISNLQILCKKCNMFKRNN